MRPHTRKRRRPVRRRRLLAIAMVVIAMAAIAMVATHRVAMAPTMPSASAAQDLRKTLNGVTLTEDQMVFTVATKNPDGSISRRDVIGRQQAEQLVQSNDTDSLTKGKEHGVER